MSPVHTLRQRKVSKRKATLLSAKVFGVRARIRRAYGSPCGRHAFAWQRNRCLTPITCLRCPVQPGSSPNSLRSNNRSPCSVWTSAPRRRQKGWGSNSNSGSTEPASQAQCRYVFYSDKLHRVSREFYRCKNLQYIQSQPNPHAAFEGI